MKRNTKMGIGIGLLILIAVIVVGVGLNQSANALTMDGNPSIGLNEDATTEKQVIPAEQAKKIALEKVNGTIVEFDFDYDDGRPEYEIEIKANGKEYDIEIDGYTGEITKFEVDVDNENRDRKSKTSTKTTSGETTSSKTTSGTTKTEKDAAKANEKQIISAEQAKKIALGKVNGTIVEFDFDYDDGRPEYEIEIKANGKEHDIEIDGYTGEITEFEIDDDD